MDRQSGFTLANLAAYAPLATRTKTSLLGRLGKNKKSIHNVAHHGRITNKSSINGHFYSNRANYIALMTLLSDETELRKLLLAEIDDLITVEATFHSPWFSSKTDELIKEIIAYDDFTDKATLPFNSFDLTGLLKIDVCVYCNRIYTNTVIGSGRSLVIRATLDHYYHQKEHPLLGLSFYNLIPSCHFCNSNLKHQKHFGLTHHCHPYKEGFDKDATFDYLQIAFHPEKSDPRNYKVLIKENIDNTNPKHKRIFGDATPDSGNVKVFELRAIYQSHADVVGELVVKSDKLSPYYAGNVVHMVSSLGASKKEFYRFYFGKYVDEKDFNKRPLAKLTKDIVSKYLPEVLV